MPNVEQLFVRPTHADRVMAALRARGAMRREELARLMGISRTTMSEVTSSLIADGAIAVVATDAGTRSGSGRPAELLALDPTSGQYMGLDFGHDRVHVVIADAAHETVAVGQEHYLSGTTWSERIVVAFDLIDKLSAGTGVHLRALKSVGVGVAGRYSTSWDEAHAVVPPAFAQRYGLQVVMDNNARFAALAEAIHTSSAPVRDLLFVRISNGIGGGLVTDGRLVQGGGGVAGELGHITVDPGGADCRCGKRGCLETVASIPPILAAATRRGSRLDSLQDLERALQMGDPVVHDVLREAAAAVGRVIAAAALIVNPAEVVIEGPLVRAAPGFVALVTATVTFETRSIDGARPSVRPAQLSEEAGAIGAIAALFRQSPLLAGYPSSPVD